MKLSRQHRIPPCPGRDGKGCPRRRHLTRASVGGLCSDCRAGTAPAWPGERPPAPAEVLTAHLDPEAAAAALERIRALCRPELRQVVLPALLEELMLSCYRQGLLDQEQLSRRTSAA